MVQLSKLREEEPEIRGDLQGRIEVFDQNIRSFEKRLRAVERRLSLETPPSQQPGRIFSGNFSGSFPEENAGCILSGASVFPHIPSITPQSSVPFHGNPLLSDSVLSFSEDHISRLTLSSVLASVDVPNVPMTSMDNSSEVSGNVYKIKTVNEVFTGLTESIRSVHASVSELANFVHNNLKPELEQQNLELQNLKSEEVTKSEYVRKLESRIEVLENQNRFTLGSIKIPLEISGIAGSSILFLTGFLVWSGRWDILRSPYFSTGLAVLMAGVVFMKFYMVNRKKTLLTD